MNINDGKEFYHKHEVFSLLAVAAIALLGLFMWKNAQINRLEEKYHAVALKAANDSALLDKTTSVLFSVRDSTKFLGDSLKAVTRLAVQEKQGKDLLDAALKQERTSNTELKAQIQVLAVTVRGTDTVKTDSGGVRSELFQIDSAPYHVRAAVKLPQRGAGTIGLGIRLDPATITVRAGCEEKPNADGIRRARVSLLTPTWLSATVEQVSQNDQICNHTDPPNYAGRWFTAGAVSTALLLLFVHP